MAQPVNKKPSKTTPVKIVIPFESIHQPYPILGHRRMLEPILASIGQRTPWMEYQSIAGQTGIRQFKVASSPNRPWEERHMTVRDCANGCEIQPPEFEEQGCVLDSQPWRCEPTIATTD